MKFKKVVFSLVLVFLAGLSITCTRDYVTGKSTFSLVSESKEIQMGKEADPAIVSEYGLYDDAALGRYIDSLGQSIAAVSQRPNLKYTFRVVDSPVVNAFALPGGYVYITRGILAHFNSEAELAGVMGHETGHVVARHGAEQMSRQQLAGIGLAVGSIVSETFRKYGGLAGAGLNLMFLSFSRSQESEADLLGVEYSTRLGYNAHHMAHFFRTIKRMSEKSGQNLPTFLSTHPDPGGREERVNRLADEWQQKVAYKPKNLPDEEYLRRIDGLVYGDDPRQGFVENDVFYHPMLKFQFAVPSGWQVVNSPSSVQIMAPKNSAVIQLTLGKGSSTGQAADNFLKNAQATVVNRKNSTVQGFPATIVESTIRSQEGTLRVLSYFIQKEENIYAFHGYTTSTQFDSYVGAFRQTLGSFDRLRNSAALDKQPQRVRIEKAKSAGTLSAVLKAQGMPDNLLEELALMNGKNLDETVAAGQWVKVLR